MASELSNRSELELRDYLHLFRRRFWLIVLLTALGVAIAAASVVFQTRIYEGRGFVVLEVGTGASVIQPNPTGQTAVTDAQVQTEAELMRSQPVNVAITKLIGYRPTVDIETTPDSPAVTVTSRSASPATAAKNVNDFVVAYVKVRRARIGKALELAREDVARQVSGLDVEIAGDKQQIAALQKELVTEPAGTSQAILKATKLARLKAEVNPDRVVARQADLQSNLDQLATRAAINQRGDNFTVSQSRVPASFVEPRPLRAGLIGFGVGLITGILAAFVRDYYDDTVRTKEDLERIATDVPVLGIIPAIKPWNDKTEAMLETLERPGSPVSEAYRALRTAVEFTGVGRDLCLIHVTSAAAGEGKSTTACNLAVALARSGKDVILVDCDLRRPRTHKFFGLDNGVGFTTLLLGTSSIEQSLHPIKDVPGLFVIPSGPLPPNPSELLDNGVTVSQLELLAKSAAYVIVDSPPLLPVADSIILGGHADATLLVVRARSTNGRSIARALELLDQVDAPVAGIVLNGVGEEGTYGYDYDYGYQGEDPRFNPSLKQRSREMVAGHAKPKDTDVAEDDDEPTRS